MMFKQDFWGRWYYDPHGKRSVTLSEALSGCKTTGEDIDLIPKKEDGSGLQKAKVSRSFECNISEEDDETEEGTEEENIFSKVEAVAKEAELLIAAAKEQDDKASLELMRKRFERFLPEFPARDVEEPEPEQVNERHRRRWFAKRRGQRLKH